jgi:endoglucanase
VKFVWNVNNDSVPDVSGNAITAYYPGDAYVDFTALDGYNFGTYASWASWRTFGSVFGTAYARVTALTNKPLFIAETGSVDVGGDKAAWIANMFQSISTTYPRITGVCWFNALKGEDWRVESSSASLAAFKTAVARGF